MYRSHRHIESDMAIHCFFEIACQLCSKGGHFPSDMLFRYSDPRTEKLQPLLLSDLRQAFFYIAKMDVYPAAQVISDWMDRITDEIETSKDWIRLCIRPLSDYEFKKQASQILLSAIENKLPPQFRPMETDKNIFILSDNEQVPDESMMSDDCDENGIPF